MAAFEVIALDTATPQLRAPGASDTYTFPRAVEMPLGTANGVLYLNGSKVMTSGSALTFDGSRLSVGAGTALNVAGYNNIVLNGSTGGLLELKSNDTRVLQIQTDGASAGAQITTVNNGSNPPLIFGVNSTEQMRLTSTGLGIGTTSPGANLQIGAASSGSQVVAVAYGATSAGTIDFRANGSAFGAAWIQHDAASGAMRFATAGNERLRLKSAGQLRYVPLAADPAGAEAGDVYYNSSTNKLRVYNGTAWVDLH